ncbi:hypothetical protein [Clostridium baratii]|uniref:hypothetical protein n=1 Tax=Clostridium baratii TaxID=1561 RepID=UPI0022E50B5E|nr:hypothetical protein [Clostridium baratii]
MNKSNTFGLITNRVFYIPSKENGISILDLFKRKDGKVILVLYYLYKRKDTDGKTHISLKSLMESCNYKAKVKVNKDTFKDILYKLRISRIIDFEGDINRIDKELEIDCNNLIEKDDGYFNFFTLEQEEIDLIRSNTTNNQNFITQLKVYCYLKARVKKIDKDRNIFERGGGETETTFRSYDDITKHTGVSAVEKSIINLKKMGLIDYVNAGMKQKEDEKPVNCSNVYALKIVSKDVKEELREGLKQYIYKIKKDGWNIIEKKLQIKKYQSEGGTKSSLKKKINKGTATKKDIDKYLELEEIQEKRKLQKKKQDEDFKRKIGLIK